jgi:hypothetical protein
MAVTQQDYIKSDPKVKAAKSKLIAAKDKLSKVDKNSTVGKSYAAEKTAAQNALDKAELAAEEYFNANIEEIQAADEKKNAGKREAAAAATERIIGSGRLNTQQIEAVRNASKKKTQPSITESDADSNNEVNVDAIKKANEELDAMKKGAKQLLADMTPKERIALAKDLSDAGIKTDALEGRPNRNLYQNYVALITRAKEENNFNKEVKGFVPYDLATYGAYLKDLTKAGGGTGNKPEIKAYISPPTEADANINSVFKAELNREATTEELGVLRKALNAYERSNPYVTTDTARTGGVRAEEYIRQLIAGQMKTKDKATAKLLGTIGKEYTTKKTDKTTIALDDIKKTAQANGLPLNDVMLQKYAQRIKNGESIDVLKKDIRSIVGATMPDSVKKLLDAGNDLDDVYTPYKTAMASVLEVPFDKIDLNDPSLSSAITADGNMPLYAFKNALRQDPRWQYTDNARQTVSSGLSQVLKDFGFMG